MNPRPSSTKMRRECFDAHKRTDETGRIYLVCWICGHQIDPRRPRDWDAEHTIRRSVGGSDEVENVMPAHTWCHDTKTKKDITENAKGKRVRDRHFGIKRSTGWNRRFKKKLNGEVVER